MVKKNSRARVENRFVLLLIGRRYRPFTDLLFVYGGSGGEFGGDSRGDADIYK